jgi:PEGA domain
MNRRVSFVMALLALSTAGCGLGGDHPAVPMYVDHIPLAIADASVVIDEQYIGPLGYVAARGMLLPLGEHRITVEKAGYFPWDKIVDADRNPIELHVKLVPIPD